ncbi:SRPBCC family protein [Lentzea sp. HUAS TT2]|uniref:SRPBCC family protein n=1 Tax=Lentzea sp. HUAS TT2 TaxID=3447454 RepID=UPI003F707D1E
MKIANLSGLVLGAAAAAVASYPLLWRKWCVTWGATDDEAQSTLPGDDLLRRPDLLTTRAITIAAPPSRIWPWLVQMGSGRGGAYTYDWIENLFGLNMHSADEILPEFQDLHVGEVLPVGEGGPTLLVEILEPDHALVLRSDDGRWVWAFVLHEVVGGTRLISRNRITVPDASLPVRWFNQLVMEPGSLVMEQKMLRGIEQRAERHP